MNPCCLEIQIHESLHSKDSPFTLGFTPIRPTDYTHYRRAHTNWRTLKYYSRLRPQLGLRHAVRHWHWQGTDTCLTDQLWSQLFEGLKPF